MLSKYIDDYKRKLELREVCGEHLWKLSRLLFYERQDFKFVLFYERQKVLHRKSISTNIESL